MLALLSAGIAGSASRFAARRGYTERMMSETKPYTDWRQVEAFVEQLHESAHAPIEAEEFYRRLLEGCVTLLAAEGGVVWVPSVGGSWREVCEVGCETTGDGVLGLLQGVAKSLEPLVLLPRSRSAAGVVNPTESVLAFVAVHDAGHVEAGASVQAIIELHLRSGSSPEVQQGWKELLVTVAAAAAQFHLHEQLRSFRSDLGCHEESLALIRRFQQTTDLRQTAFEIANEGRRFVAGDRLSVMVRRGKSWQLLAASGVDRIETRSDLAKRQLMLADATAAWGEPLEYADASFEELPPDLAKLVEQHIDETQARRLIAVPIEFVEPQDQQATRHTRPGRIAAVLIAEQFTCDADEFSQQRVLELAVLCEPALRQAMLLDRFPVRSCLRWADRWAEVRENSGVTKLTVASVAALAVLLALVFVKVDFEVEAPATLGSRVEREIFATAEGQVADVRIRHGEQVAVGDVLAVLHDPQLALDEQRVEGEISTMRKRLEAIAVARTDRRVREEASVEKLPLSAEAEQLRKRLSSLRSQQEILTHRRNALTLRTPIAGTVLTLDVQNLLRTRPVERGQVLFTVADTSAGWRLLANLPQDRIGQVVAAQRQEGAALAARFRLAGDTQSIYMGHVESISTAAVLDTAGLDQEIPVFEVNLAVDESDLPLARPGMNAQVRILCGRRSLGYVWLHDIWETLYSFFVF